MERRNSNRLIQHKAMVTTRNHRDLSVYTHKDETCTALETAAFNVKVFDKDRAPHKSLNTQRERKHALPWKQPHSLQGTGKDKES
jgi:hypothetical protein